MTFEAAGEATLTNVTVTGNTADVDADCAGEGGRLVVGSGSAISIPTFLAGNKDASPAGDPRPVRLSAVYPNPFNPEARFTLGVARP